MTKSLPKTQADALAKLIAAGGELEWTAWQYKHKANGSAMQALRTKGLVTSREEIDGRGFTITICTVAGA